MRAWGEGVIGIDNPRAGGWPGAQQAGHKPRLPGVAVCFLLLVASPSARAETLVVAEARGIGSTAGESIDAAKHLSLRRGEHVRLIGQNGNQYCLDGPYDGPAKPAAVHHSSYPDWFTLLVFGTGVGQGTDPLTDCLR
jgi:hypothetical protein